jgi:hypothetical protein
MHEEGAVNLRQSIRQALGGELSGQALLRQFLNHEDWHVPAGRDDAGRILYVRLRDGQGRRYLFLCTDRQAYDDCVARVGEAVMGRHYVTAPGVDVFAGLPAEADVDVIGINEYSPPEMHYRSQQVPALQQWARAVRVERTLATPAPDLGTVKRFDSYYVVMQRLEGDEHALTLAPDKRGRKLAAVFTAPDTAEAFLRDQGDGGIKFAPVTVAVGGEQLFRDLQNLPIDGIVFNCVGPVPPRTFVPDFARAVVYAP